MCISTLQVKGLLDRVQVQVTMPKDTTGSLAGPTAKIVGLGATEKQQPFCTSPQVMAAGVDPLWQVSTLLCNVALLSRSMMPHHAAMVACRLERSIICMSACLQGWRTPRP